MKKVLAVSAVTAALFVGAISASSAATVTSQKNLGTFNDQDSTLDIGKSYTSGTSFTDIYTFSLNGLSGTASFSLTNTGLAIKNFVGKLYAGVFDGSQTAIASTNIDTTRPQNENFAGSFPNGDVPIGKGTYSFVVTGDTQFGNKGASVNSVYSGTGYFQVSSVPLPSTVALFGVALAGLGVAGTIRRKSATTAA